MSTTAEETRRTVPAAHEGETRIYVSSRAVAGYPYLAPCLVRAYRRKDGRLVWRPEGPLSTPQQVRGVPSDWVRDGTEAARDLIDEHAGAPRPWEYADEAIPHGGDS